MYVRPRFCVGHVLRDSLCSCCPKVELPNWCDAIFLRVCSFCSDAKKRELAFKQAAEDRVAITMQNTCQFCRVSARGGHVNGIVTGRGKITGIQQRDSLFAAQHNAARLVRAELKTLVTNFRKPGKERAQLAPTDS